jgi:hypothetical protein
VDTTRKAKVRSHVRAVTIIDSALIKIIDGQFRSRRKYRWPLLSSTGCDDEMLAFASAWDNWMSSPAPNPGDVAAKPTAKIHCGCVQRKLPGRRPKLKLVAVTVAPMASVATDRHVHRERALPANGPGVMQRTVSVPLYPRSTRGLEPKQVQHPLHRREIANSIEVDAGHSSSSLS